MAVKFQKQKLTAIFFLTDQLKHRNVSKQFAERPQHILAGFKHISERA